MRRLGLWLLAALLPLAGCHHGHVRAAAPPSLPTPEPAPVAVSVPPPTHPTEPLPKPEAAPQPAPPAAAPVKTPHHHRGTPAAAVPAAPAPAPPITPAPAATIDLGNLTTGTETGGQLRQESADLMRNQNDRLAKLPSPLQDRYAHQLNQVRLFLKQAQDSWQASDYEGARTLATKARVLLDEIQRP